MKKSFFLLFAALLLSPLLYARAQSVDLLWQGNGYVPPFYQGRTIWSKQSGVTVVAFTQGLGNQSGLFFKWSKNGTVLGNTNGLGKNSLSFLDSILSKPQTIKVEVLSGEEVLASSSIVLAPASPSLLVYENSPLYGFLFHKEAGGIYELAEKEITFAAFPLFFSIRDRADNSVGYSWRTNVGEAETGNSVMYRTPDDTSGSSEVSVSASNKDEITQDARKSFLVKFGEQ
ncbi:MAG: hypothetical protein Q7S54_00770 [bacterium]|nr:hypothetical protein [bacterium]